MLGKNDEKPNKARANAYACHAACWRMRRAKHRRGSSLTFGKMDTDDLTPMAYGILRMAYDACEPMRAEIGAAARGYRTEDEYLVGIAELLREVLDDPSGYLESWNLEEEVRVGVFVKAVEGIIAHVNSTLATPRIERGKPPFEA